MTASWDPRDGVHSLPPHHTFSCSAPATIPRVARTLHSRPSFAQLRVRAPPPSETLYERARPSSWCDSVRLRHAGRTGPDGLPAWALDVSRDGRGPVTRCRSHLQLAETTMLGLPSLVPRQRRKGQAGREVGSEAEGGNSQATCPRLFQLACPRLLLPSLADFPLPFLTCSTTYLSARSP